MFSAYDLNRYYNDNHFYYNGLLSPFYILDLSEEQVSFDDLLIATPANRTMLY